MRPRFFLAIAVLVSIVFAQSPNPFRATRPGIKEVQVPFSSLKATRTFNVGGHADWIAVSDRSVWVATSEPNTVQEIDPLANKIVAKISVAGEPCSGLALGFGSLWVPLCTTPPSLVRVDMDKKIISATLPFGPAASEGSIAVGEDSVWLVTDLNGTLARIDPATNRLKQLIKVQPGSQNMRVYKGKVWITSVPDNSVTPVDASTGKVEAKIGVGPNPRFLSVGGGSVWTLNQGDGTVTRIDAKTRRVTGTIQAGLPGKGGDVCFGDGALWTTIFTIPLGRIEAATNRVSRQWTGPGGDSLGCGDRSLWLTDYERGLLQRFDYRELER
jgi:YVTN family beta-propeller protein